ncbi:ClpP family protease [Actinospica robiniae]|uniref:ClpP family protease n=1 Tax=Actinospica robiniae TaxID=304901 RepID=UPI0003FD426C|nr:ATP-dependent Clp protease proteolytic subunit [Actinospica robiniae]
MTHFTFDDELAHQLFNQRIVFLGREIDDGLAERVCAQLLVLSAQDPRADISMFINSVGGSVTAGLAVYDTMQLIPNDLATIVTGLAAGMGQLLLTAGTAGKRSALTNARVLMHQPAAGVGGTAADIATRAKSHEHAKSTVRRIIVEHTGQPEAAIERDSERDRWFTAEQAREYRLVDRVVTALKDIRSPEPSRRVGL